VNGSASDAGENKNSNSNSIMDTGVCRDGGMRAGIRTRVDV